VDWIFFKIEKEITTFEYGKYSVSRVMGIFLLDLNTCTHAYNFVQMLKKQIPDICRKINIFSLTCLDWC
jgi:hypothetical protein